MKKILMAFMIGLISLSASANQNNSLLNRVQAEKMYVFTQDDLLNKLDTSKMSQKKRSRIENAFNKFNEEMSIAYNSKNRKKKTIKAINKNVDKMYVILSEKEYRSYIKIINEEISNRGIEWF